MGKYTFQCSAVRRSGSHEEFKNTQKDEILNDLEAQVNLTSNEDLEESHIPAYSEEITCTENKQNNITNRLAINIYTYHDKADYTYGGYQDY